MKKMETQVLVIGSGVAGLYYALKCSRFASVLLITKGSIGECNTRYAQGGIAAVFDRNDSIAEHVQDTLMAGDGLCDKDAVQLIAEHAHEAILDLNDLQVRFDKSDKGSFDLHREGGHSHARIVHTADATGMEVENALVNQVRRSANIHIMENCFALDLIVQNNSCSGAWVLDEANRIPIQIQAEIVMLASGGAGQVYVRNTNPVIATGDGYAMAHRAGAQIANMEFVQFHPTTFHKADGSVFLITEAVRGLGVELKDGEGKPFMQSYHPLGSLAPRDVVTRAIISELQRSGDNCVYLDTTVFDSSTLQKHFPNIYQFCLDEGFNPALQMIPVVPAAHYMCGGVVTDRNGKTSIENLYACGEVSCTGVHGANRLASNSLLEGLVFARQAASDTEYSVRQPATIAAAPSTYLIRTDNENSELKKQKKTLQEMMWADAGIIRNGKDLEACKSRLATMYQNIKINITRRGVSVADMELMNMIEASLLIVQGALDRKESRGCHYRSDYPNKIIVSDSALVAKF